MATLTQRIGVEEKAAFVFAGYTMLIGLFAFLATVLAFNASKNAVTMAFLFTALVAIPAVALGLSRSWPCFDMSELDESEPTPEPEDDELYDSYREFARAVWDSWWGEKTHVERVHAWYSIFSGMGLIAVTVAVSLPVARSISVDHFAPMGNLLTRFTVIAIVGIPVVKWKFPSYLIAAKRGESIPIEDGIDAAYSDVRRVWQSIMTYWPAVIGSISVWIILGMVNSFLLFEQSNGTLSYTQIQDMMTVMPVIVVALAMTQLTLWCYVINPGFEGAKKAFRKAVMEW